LPFSGISVLVPRAASFWWVLSGSWARSRCTPARSDTPTEGRSALRVPAKGGGSWRSAGAMTIPRGTPQASTTIERLMPPLPRPTGLPPAISPPQGALARGLGGAAVGGRVGRFGAGEAIARFERHPPQPVRRPGFDTLVASAPEGGWRALLACDPPVGTTEDQDPHRLLEDRPVWDARPAASRRVVRSPLGGGAQNCSRMARGRTVGWRARPYSFASGSFENPPDDRVCRVRSANLCQQARCFPIGASTL
jgi:hypothetical protein